MIVKKTEFKIVSRGKPARVKLRRSPDESVVREAFRGILSSAVKDRKRNIVVAPVGIAEGFPPIGAAKIVSQEVLRFCRAHPGTVKSLSLVIEDSIQRKLFEHHVYGYLRHVQEDLGCGPYCTVDIIIEYRGGIVVIERTNPPFGYALPGGFVDNGETLEHAAVREAKEETNLTISGLKQFHTYSDPSRDPRFQTISTVFVAKGKGELNAGDDAKGACVIPVVEILNHKFAFDHKEIIRDYLRQRSRS